MVVDCGEVLSHAARLVFGAGVVDAAADADVEPSDERRAVGDAENAHRRGQVLRVTLFSGLVAHAVECARKVDAVCCAGRCCRPKSGAAGIFGS